MISMGELSQLEWRNAWWGWLMLQPLAMLVLLKLKRAKVLHYADNHLHPWVMRGNFGLKQGVGRSLIFLFAWFLLACAAAGPRLPIINTSGQKTPSYHQHTIDMMVVLDVSPSMQANDISPNRLQRAKLELQDLIPQLHGERIGLIAFSGSAGLVMPLTGDYSAFQYYLHLAEPGLFEVPGSAIAASLELARKKLLQEKAGGRAILLITDAEASAFSGAQGVALLESAKQLKKNRIPLYILGVGTKSGASIPLADGGVVEQDGVPVISRLDQPGFTSIAELTNGKFAQVEDGDADWQKIYEKGILTIPGSKLPAENVHAWQELYPWFLILSLVLFTWYFFPFRLNRPKPVAAAVMLVLVLSVSNYGTSKAYAAESDWQEAYSAYRQKNYTLAQTLYTQLHGFEARMGEGAAAYRRKDYHYAVKQFSSALLQAKDIKQREKALFNLGNSYFQAGNYRASSDAYLGVLSYALGNPSARANLALSAGMLAKQVKLDKYSEGILGRRGSQTGGDVGRDIGDVPVSMEPAAVEKSPIVRSDNEQLASSEAKLRQGGKSDNQRSPSNAVEADRLYRSALKKLELVADKPMDLQKELMKLEGMKDAAPPGEMLPW
ncbi:vWA domain-containing protein [Sulfurirhabdus autotrophica]|uniref:Ca-activated chloride channel family protein n=1 Tax=Sulfurirhabdus autotrophica TaxID=1706046 RepID=A0A4R3XY01_9PROT|nr:VWA domain-containing protein [Sulfurirhabdus autotrophica]TCV82533.1 Ca-activated chloride channel family protein [Sulfurirhabdus autotrophica]